MPHTKRVFDALEKRIEDLKLLSPKSLLYVGWRHDCKPWWYDTFAKNIGASRVGVLEIFPKNIVDLEKQVWLGRYDVEPILGNVVNAQNYIKKNEWDFIFWDHGPEHVSKEDLVIATETLFNLANKAVIYCCPWGDWPQGMEDGNEYEVHRNAVTVQQLKDINFDEIQHFAKPGQEQEGELLAFKFVEKNNG